VGGEYGNHRDEGSDGIGWMGGEERGRDEIIGMDE
jgi:hypothetical protein